MNKIRLGIIGLGNIGAYHADYLLKGIVRRCELVAVCGRDTAALAARFPTLRAFADGHELFQSGAVDAVIIATPHFQHVSLGIAAFQNGIHALVEKPIAAHKADAERLIEAHQRCQNVVFAGMFQLRAEPRYHRIQQLLREGSLGQIQRVHWISTDWFRTETYYASGGWRATWRGEGGGVLLNQCLHPLDTLQWLCGMPKRVRGFCQMGRFHHIEVEDNVTAYLEWSDGSTGTFVGSTGESPGTNRLEIAGSRGSLVLEQNRLRYTCNSVDALEFSRAATQGFVKPDAKTEEISIENAEFPHAQMTQNFINAILDGEPLIAPGAEGIHSVELANSILYSSLLGETLELPLNGAAWERKLNQLIAESTMEKTVRKVVTDDVAGSFRK